ncbi:MAG: tRNA (adenosine(37)-N6)-threonylcarbamoyltransferase complex dimerization subunit type 1 TsaB [Eubacteriales bacterium]|nr:tRNA (adenosine(37)-N6)-threonylcarbamoyltransferase complex dimerization subunit type 1 TsaB [Eubacteriales bacterium]
MLLLSVSTSSSTASAALSHDGALLALLKGESGLTHSETILPLCERLLEEHGLSARDIDAYAVDIGPGSFTGVRIGICAVNAMAAASNCAVAGVCSLDALHESAKQHTSVCALIDAKSKKVYAAHYENGAAKLPPCATTLHELLPLLPRGSFYVGDGAAAYAEDILAFDETANVHRGGALFADAVAAKGYIFHQSGDAQREALPLYLRPSQAERLRGAGKETV